MAATPKSLSKAQSTAAASIVKTPSSSTKSVGGTLIDGQILAFLLVIAYLVRFYLIEHPASAVFDEVHFGKFSSRYLKNNFFLDVHPPLGKLIYALVLYCFGYTDTFTLTKVGESFDQFPHVILRSVSAFFGLLLVPIAYMSMRRLGSGRFASTLTCLMLIFENGLVTQSRLILLDSFLLAFTAWSAYSWLEFTHSEKSAFTFKWWFWLGATGVGLGLAMSIKWISLFTFVTVGILVIKNLWDLLDDLTLSLVGFIRHFLARFVCLLILPALIYYSVFVVHFAIVYKDDPSASFLSYEFQATLEGSASDFSVPADVAYGSVVSIRHVNSRGGYLHSHKASYPGGSSQQQITLYRWNDTNNHWLLLRPEQPFNKVERVEWIQDGDIVTLMHMNTFRKLHSHKNKPMVTDAEGHTEVTCYGFYAFPGDDNDYWRVEIYDHNPKYPESKHRLMAVHSRFRLRHVNQNCYLFSDRTRLPTWGFKQQEVTCMQNSLPRRTIWRIDDNYHPLLPKDSPKASFEKLSPLQMFIELNQVMWRENMKLISSHPYGSTPASWPLLKRGIRYWTGGEGDSSIYLFGNPLVWVTAFTSVLFWLVFQFVMILRDQRHYEISESWRGIRERVDNAGGMLFLAWMLHFLPFFMLHRQLFLYHYFPALYFSILMFGFSVDLVFSRSSKSVKWVLSLGLALSIVACFVLWSPWTYGLTVTTKYCESLKLRSQWDWMCPLDKVVATEPTPEAGGDSLALTLDSDKDLLLPKYEFEVGEDDEDYPKPTPLPVPMTDEEGRKEAAQNDFQVDTPEVASAESEAPGIAVDVVEEETSSIVAEAAAASGDKKDEL